MSSVGKSSRPATWSEKRRGKTPAYKYFTLSEIYDENCTPSTKCNIYGIVTDFKEPSKSRGSDYFSLVFIVDKTSQQPLKIRLFHRDSSYFPEVHLGDIIRFHRLKVYKPSSDIKDVLLTSTKGWSWVLWKNTNGLIVDDVLNEGKSSSESYTLLDSDKETIESLRAWQSGKPPEQLARPSGHIRSVRISGIKHGDHLKLLCQVIAVEKLSDSNVALKVWDGTKPTVYFEPIPELTEQDTVGVNDDIPQDYMVHISIHDDHVSVWEDLGLSEGSFVVFDDLHAWPNPSVPANASVVRKQWRSSELVLHSGNAYGRGIRAVRENEEYMTDVMTDIGTVEAFVSSDKAERSQDTQIAGATLDLLQQLEKEAVVETGAGTQQEDVGDDLPQCSTGGSNSIAGRAATGAAREDYVTEALSLTSTDSENEETEGTFRCMQESVTVVTGGEGIPQKLTELKQVTKFDVAVHRSKLFRVRVRIVSCVAPEDAFAVHFCPVTGIYFATRNTGEQLEVSQNVENFVKAWRQVQGIDTKRAQTTDDELDLIEVPNSQWDLPGPDGVAKPVDIKRYVCVKDGSKWESIETDDHVIRKRKQDGERFTVMYKRTESHDYSPETLMEWGATYNRVVRFVPLNLQLSANPPPVAYQGGVFYYSSQPFAVEPTLPSLKLEAEMFDESRISHAMGSPTLVPRIMLNLTLGDKSSELKNVWLTGRSAVDFFDGITPQDYLVDRGGSAELVRQCLSTLVDTANWMECIIEKKSRQKRSRENQPFYVYSICNTKLKEA